ncbi:MAG: nuclear transport factor 2 family protein [Burkholderiales bacterium]|jgi:hypothetical protein|nr:nuclear transport factor 2 family protein [Burkholderiales bacterium]
MGLAERFYDALSVADHHTMGLMYAPTATFSDPVFPMLSGPEAALMWEMLLTRSRDFSVSYNVREDDSRAEIVWVARHRFGRNSRPVENRVRTEMTFQAGRIVRQVDRFGFWAWSRQALGLPGWLLGWTPLLQHKVQADAQQQLILFAESKFGRNGMPAAR